MNPNIEILATIKRFDGNKLDEEALASIARIDLNTGIEAISWLLDQRYIYRHKGKYHTTELGDAYIADVGFYSLKDKSLKDWKDEVTTGLVERRSRKSGQVVTTQSRLTRAVMSTSTINAPEGIRPDQIVMELDNLMSMRKALCQELGISMSQYEILNDEGRLRVCKCGGEHIGIFDKDRDRFRHICRKCAKRKRQERRDKRRLEKDGGTA